MASNYYEVQKRIAELEEQKGLTIKESGEDKKHWKLIRRGLSLDDKLIDIWVSKTGGFYRVGQPDTDLKAVKGDEKGNIKSYQEAHYRFGIRLFNNEPNTYDA